MQQSNRIRYAEGSAAGLVSKRGLKENFFTTNKKKTLEMISYCSEQIKYFQGTNEGNEFIFSFRYPLL